MSNIIPKPEAELNDLEIRTEKLATLLRESDRSLVCVRYKEPGREDIFVATGFFGLASLADDSDNIILYNGKNEVRFGDSAKNLQEFAIPKKDFVDYMLLTPVGKYGRR